MPSDLCTHAHIYKHTHTQHETPHSLPREAVHLSFWRRRWAPDIFLGAIAQGREAPGICLASCQLESLKAICPRGMATKGKEDSGIKEGMSCKTDRVALIWEETHYQAFTQCLIPRLGILLPGLQAVRLMVWALHFWKAAFS